ncbi:MAG: M1 family metallopeptidase [Planctomycetota bacterium]
MLLASISACVVPPKDSAVLDPPVALVQEIPDRGYDVLSYGLDLKIHPELAKLEGYTRITLRTTRALDTLVFDAADMEILSVQSELSSRFLEAFTYDRRELTIPVPYGMEEGEIMVVGVTYRTAPLAGMHFSLPGENGLEHPPHVFTQGEAERARFWFPCNDHPSDRASHTLRATVPRTWMTVAAGQLMARTLDESGLEATDTWVMDEDMPPYLFTFVAGPLLKLEDRWEDVPLWYVGEPADGSKLEASFGETPEILTFLSDYTGFRYPFQKYAQVAVRDFPFGGMENVSATTVTRNALHTHLYQEGNPSWGLVAHEAAHQWFGDIISCEDWPHAWLNEGFASYFTLLYGRHRDGEAVFQASMGRTLDGYMRACEGEGLRALVKHEYRLPFDLFFDGTIYPGGAARLNLFRGILGEETFREALKIYMHGNAYRSVDSDAFLAAMENASGRDLKGLYDQWVYQPGYPELDVSWTRRGRDLQVHVTQMQSITGGVPSAFQFPLDVRWYEDGNWRETRLQVEREDQVFSIETGNQFDGWVEFDPHVYVPGRFVIHERASATRVRAQKGWSSRARLLAVRDLADYRDAETLELLWDTARADEVAAVRQEAIASLRKLHPGAAAEISRVRSAFQTETDDRTRAAWWGWIAASVEDPVIEALLQETLDNQDALTGLRVTAFRAIGNRMDPAPRFAFASQWLQNDEGEGQRLRLAALAMLAGTAGLETDSSLAVQVRGMLLPYSWKGRSTPVRSAALRHLAPWLMEIDPRQDPAQRSGQDRALVETYRKALLSFSSPLRRAAASGIAGHHALFQDEIRTLMQRDPDPKLRRSLER